MLGLSKKEEELKIVANLDEFKAIEKRKKVDQRKLLRIVRKTLDGYADPDASPTEKLRQQKAIEDNNNLLAFYEPEQDIE